MKYTMHYFSPLGGITLACDHEGLTGLWFDGQKYYALGLSPESLEYAHPLLKDTVRWLDCYFSGTQPEFMPPLHLIGSPFRKAVWELLLEIPRGKTVTYGELAAKLGRKSMSAQAVGGAVGHNPVSLIVPCHHVIGADGSLTGYAGGTDKKIRLLTLEGADTSKMRI